MDLTQLNIGERVGQGGMGTVHRALWKSPMGGVPVAVKFIHGTRKMGADVAFLREARAAARLSHPNVVTLLDAGRVVEPEGPAEPGIPYLVMEWVDGQTLRDNPPKDWAETLEVMRGLLDALGHAHGWGVLHRDMKPGNGMRAADGVVRLMDFGVGRVLNDFADPETGRRTQRITGTPSYMAPEQVLGEWRDEGPWTDIYGLGSLVWELVTGEAPFVGDMQDVLVAQVRERPPNLKPRFAVPPALRNWLYTALEKKPRDRFRSAAEALAALSEMDHGDRTSRYPVVTPGRANSNVATKLSVPQRHPSDDLPISTELRAAGAGLFGMREPPLVGRETEKEQLWNALRRVSRLERAELAVLSGPTGVGKTALANWLVRRTTHGGHAAILHSAHEEGVAGEVALSGAVMRWFRLDGLGSADALERLTVGLQGLGYDAAREVALDVIARRWPSSTERRGLHDSGPWFRFLLDFAEKVGGGAPVVWVIEDVHLSPVSREFIELAGQAEFALYVVATTRSDEAIDVRRSFEMKLGPQSDASMRSLIQSMLPLEPVLADSLVSLAQGSPIFAIQLLGDWIARDILEPGPLGYKTNVDVTKVLPADVKALWLARVGTALTGHGSPGLDALRQLAVMGDRVGLDLWRQACELIDVADLEPIIEALTPYGLVTLDGEEVQLAHGLLRESLIQDVDLTRQHLAAADALAAGGQSPRDAERAARHLWAAGRQLPGLDQLYDAIVRYDHAEDGDAVIFLVPLLAEWAEAANEADNVCLADAWLRLHLTLRHRASLEDSQVPLERAAAIVMADTGVEAMLNSTDALRKKVAAGVLLGRAARVVADDPRLALSLFRDAHVLAVSAGAAGIAISAAARQAEVLASLDDVDGAHRVLNEALTVLAGSPIDKRTTLRTNLQLAEIFDLRGEYDEAIDALKRAEEAARTIGALRALGYVTNRRADLLAFTGDLQGAREVARTAAEVYASAGSWAERVCHFNALIYSVMAGNAERHREAAHHFVSECEVEPMLPYHPIALVVASVCEHAAGDFDRAGRLFARATRGEAAVIPREILILAVLLAETADEPLKGSALRVARSGESRLPPIYRTRLSAMA